MRLLGLNDMGLLARVSVNLVKDMGSVTTPLASEPGYPRCR